MNDNFLYVMSDGTDYKIGVSKNPVQRAREIKHDIKKEITILLSINCLDAYGCERYIHNKYKYLNTGREWFAFPNREFLQDVWDVCINNLVHNDSFISIDSKRNQVSEKLNAFVTSCQAVTYDFVFKLLNDKQKYNHNTIPNMLRNLGCVKVSRAKGVFYVTPNGLDIGIEKQNVNTLIAISNKII